MIDTFAGEEAPLFPDMDDTASWFTGKYAELTAGDGKVGVHLIGSKDRHGKYTSYDPRLLDICGFDSDASVLGKTDDDLGWGASTAEVVLLEKIAAAGTFVERAVVMRVGGQRLEHKFYQLIPHPNGNGHFGTYVDICRFELDTLRMGNDHDEYAKKSILLPEIGERVSWMEYCVLRGMVGGSSTATIARHLGISTSRVADCRKRLNVKLQTTSKWLPYSALYHGVLIKARFKQAWSGR